MSLTTISSGVYGIDLKTVSRSESQAPLVTGSGYVPRTGLKVVANIKIFFLQGNEPRGRSRHNRIALHKMKLYSSFPSCRQQKERTQAYMSRQETVVSGICGRQVPCILGAGGVQFQALIALFICIIRKISLGSLKKWKVRMGRTCSKHYKKTPLNAQLKRTDRSGDLQ